MRLKGNPFQNRPVFLTLQKRPIENIAGKGENAGNQHFLLFLQCFLPVKANFDHLSHIQIVVLTPENIAGKGENAGNYHFLVFLQCFLPFKKLWTI